MAKSVLTGAAVGAVLLSVIFAVLMAIGFDQSVHYVFVHAEGEIKDAGDAAYYGAGIGIGLGALIGALSGAIIRGIVVSVTNCITEKTSN